MIGLISCSAQKRDRAAPARELYTSALFCKSLAYAERRCAHVYVASAKHGLVALDHTIEPYDLRITQVPPAARAAWAEGIVSDLLTEHPHGLRGERFLLLAGEMYADPIVAELLTWDVDREAIGTPLAGMQIGQRLSFLNRDAHELVRAAALGGCR